ncbi:hypothetical protein MARHY3561 [Marinobacter nauticus ATCC 49840]|nr:hypothetical protein MARHY3561 [Marinobacter nauticus ATCC 49840]
MVSWRSARAGVVRDVARAARATGRMSFMQNLLSDYYVLKLSPMKTDKLR